MCDRVHRGGIDFRVTGSYLQLKRRTVEGISYKHYSPSEALFFTSTVADWHVLHCSSESVVIADNISSNHTDVFHLSSYWESCYFSPPLWQMCYKERLKLCWLHSFQAGFLSQTETKVELNWEPFGEFKCFMVLRSQNESLLFKKTVTGCTLLLSIMLIFTNLWPQLLDECFKSFRSRDYTCYILWIYCFISVPQ